jgi:hypothetical protein
MLRIMEQHLQNMVELNLFSQFENDYTERNSKVKRQFKIFEIVQALNKKKFNVMTKIMGLDDGKEKVVKSYIKEDEVVNQFNI